MSLNPISQIQSDIEFILKQAATLGDVPVFSRARGVTEQDVENALAVINDGNGKVGACVIVQMPLVDVPLPDPPGPHMEATFVVTVMESPLLNRGDSGHNITAEDLVCYILHELHGRHLGDSVGSLYAARQAAEPVPEAPANEVHYNISFVTQFQLEAPPRTRTPVISGNAAGVQLTCNTPAASIFYTLDGSYPAESNPSASLFGITLATEDGTILVTQDGTILGGLVDPFPVAAGTRVRAAAFATGKQGSHVAAATIAAA